MKGEHLGELEELVLLAVRACADDAYGVTVQRTIENHAARRVTLGAVYSALDRLESKNFVASRLGGKQAQQGGRRKRLFRLTAGGRSAVAAARRARASLWDLAEASDG